MKAISIRQPWAWLILNHGKDIENRVWPTKFRGRVLVHASATMTKAQWKEAGAFVAQRRGIDPPISLPPYGSLDCGGIVGSVEIVDCVTASTSPWFTGRFGFVLRDPHPLPFVPLKGSLRFFEAPLERVETA